MLTSELSSVQAFGNIQIQLVTGHRPGLSAHCARSTVLTVIGLSAGGGNACNSPVILRHDFKDEF